MADLKNLSDAELESMIAQKSKKDSFNVKDLSDEQLDRLIEAAPMLEKEGIDLGVEGLKYLSKAGAFVDKYTGAPTRAAFGAFQDAKGFEESVTKPLQAFGRQFGDNPAYAPTGAMIAEKAGFDAKKPVATITLGGADKPGSGRFFPGGSEKLRADIEGREYVPPEGVTLKPTMADLVGFGVDVSFDPANIIPGVLAGKTVLRAGKTAGKALANVGMETGRVIGELGIEAGRGLKNAAQTLPGAERAARAAQKSAEILEKTAKGTAEVLQNYFKTSFADDIDRYVQIGNKHGINMENAPDAIKFGPNSGPSKLHRKVMEAGFAPDEVAKFETFQHEVQGAIDNKISDIAGGEVLDQKAAGEVIREGYNRAVEKMFDSTDFTYSEITRQVPGIALTEESTKSLGRFLNAVKETAADDIASGIASMRSEANEILDVVKAIENTNGDMAKIHKIMTRVGKRAFKAKSAVDPLPSNVKELRNIYSKLRDEFINSTDTLLGADIANSLKNSNDTITKFIKDRAPIEKILARGDQVAGEDIFKQLVLNGNSKKIDSLNKILEADEISQLKGAFLESLAGRNINDKTPYRTFHNAIRGKQSTASMLFRPEELTDVMELLELGDRAGLGVLNTSGTEISNMLRDLGQGAQQTTVNRIVLEQLREKAAQNAARGAGGVAEEVVTQAPRGLERIPDILPPSLETRGFPFKRTTPDDIAKVLQVISAQQQNGEDSAVLRRLKQNAERRAQ